jgi:hypothetical protein
MLNILTAPIRLIYYLIKNVILEMFSTEKRTSQKSKHNNSTNSFHSTSENTKSNSSKFSNSSNSKFQTNQDSILKGNRFEKYIVEKINVNKNYKLKEWRGDKFHEGHYAESNLFPDLEFEVINGVESHFFAVECKWRSSFFNNSIDIVKETQLSNYWRYSAQKKIPVFVAIGIGVENGRPKELYILPLDRIRAGQIHKNQLLPFQKNTFDNLQYDARKNCIV